MYVHIFRAHASIEKSWIRPSYLHRFYYLLVLPCHFSSKCNKMRLKSNSVFKLESLKSCPVSKLHNNNCHRWKHYAFLQFHCSGINGRCHWCFDTGPRNAVAFVLTNHLRKVQEGVQHHFLLHTSNIIFIIHWLLNVFLPFPCFHHVCNHSLHGNC